MVWCDSGRGGCPGVGACAYQVSKGSGRGGGDVGGEMMDFGGSGAEHLGVGGGSEGYLVVFAYGGGGTVGVGVNDVESLGI